MRKIPVKKTGTDIKYFQVPDEPGYHPEEDIYQQEKKVPFQEESLTGNPVKKPPFLADDLDIPGTELDDSDELIGEEDEENNYYSLGGDNHHDLDEDRGIDL